MITEGVSARPYENRYQKTQKRPNVNFKSQSANLKTLEDNQEKDSKFGIKTLTNMLGVAAWLGIVGYSIKDLKLLQRKSPEVVAASVKSLKKQVLSYSEKAADQNANQKVQQALENTDSKGLRKKLYNIGNWFQNAKMKTGGELFNNYLYALGTLIVMPAVVMFSPIGKKDSSKEDKLFAVLRQPVSVASTLGMQFTFDKLIDKYVPEVIKQNQLEDKAILDEKGKIKFVDENGNFIMKNYDAVKFNSDEAKEGFKTLVSTDKEKGGLKGILSADELKELFTNKSFESDEASTYENKLVDIINTKFADKKLKLESLDDIAKNSESYLNFKKLHEVEALGLEQMLLKFKRFTTVLDLKTIVTQKSKTWVNVVAASIIGCTFLNVVYGKMMKALRGKIATDDVKQKEQPPVLNVVSENGKEVK